MPENEYAESFYDQDRIVDWHKAGTTALLLKVNENIIKEMQQTLIKK